MATVQTLNTSFTVSQSEIKLIELCLVIFQSTDFSNVEKEIGLASKIRIGLKAITSMATLDEDEVPINQKIVVGLNKLAKVY